MTTLKKAIIVIINFLFISVMFGLINNKIKWSIHESKVKKGSVIYEYFDIKDDILVGVIVTFFVYVIYGLLYKVLSRKMGIVAASLIMGLISYSIPYLIITTMIFHSQKTLWISIIPFFIIGFLLPFSERWIATLLSKGEKN